MNGYVISRVVGSAVEREWIEPIIHIADCEIVPVATYKIEAIQNSVSVGEEVFTTVGKPGAGKHWGDVAGLLVDGAWTPPNGFANVQDIVCMVGFFNNSGGGTSAHRSWVDVTGPSDGTPNVLVTVGDIQAVVKGVNGETFLGSMGFVDPGDCPPTMSPVMGQGDPITVSVSASDDFLDPQEWLYVDVFTGAVDDLGAYQVALEVTGGSAGTLILTDIEVNTQRSDYVFGTDAIIEGKNVSEGRVGVVREGGGIAVTGTKYVATFVYQPAAGASGVFEIALKEGEGSFLNDGAGNRLNVVLGSEEVVGIGIDCWQQWHCNDNNQCTTDACVNYECVFTNSTQGTSCNDGLFCTATDTCDGSGQCSGTGNPCPRTQWCNEFQDQCEDFAGGEE